jgi:hypothetical protein
MNGEGFSSRPFRTAGVLCWVIAASCTLWPEAAAQSVCRERGEHHKWKYEVGPTVHSLSHGRFEIVGGDLYVTEGMDESVKHVLVQADGKDDVVSSGDFLFVNGETWGTTLLIGSKREERTITRRLRTMLKDGKAAEIVVTLEKGGKQGREVSQLNLAHLREAEAIAKAKRASLAALKKKGRCR